MRSWRVWGYHFIVFTFRQGGAESLGDCCSLDLEEAASYKSHLNEE